MIKAKVKLIVIIIVIIITAFAGLIVLSAFALNYVQKKSQAKFSRLLSTLDETMSYPEAEQILGKPTRTFTERKDVEEWGTAKDNKITEECNLHMFLRMDVIPHRYILIYEDKKTHLVRLVTWMYP